MADKKLNEVSQLTDFDYALVVKGNDVAKVTKQQLATILEVSSVGTIDLKPDVDVNMKLQEGIYAFYDNYAISGFILTVSDNIYTDRSKIIAGEKSTSLSMEFSSNGVTFHSNTSRKLHYRLLAYYK